MRTEWIAALIMLLPVAAPAQEVKQRPVRTERITGAPVGVGLYEIAPDGTVLIDWRAIEATAEGPADKPPTSVAKALLAVRDGKWKPMNR